MGRRILVLSASVGVGHLRAAEAVELALRQMQPEATVENLDVLTLTGAVFRQLYCRAYVGLGAKAPHLMGFFYDNMDRPGLTGLGDLIRRIWQQTSLTRLTRFLRNGRWDLIINTHFLPAEIIAGLRTRGRLDVPQATAITDFHTHRLWIHQPCDRYFTAAEEGARNLSACGVPAADVEVTGIPIHPVFAVAKERGECLARQGLAGDRPIVLQLAGGFGSGPVERIHRELLSMDQPIELVTVTGRNERVRKELEQIEPPPRHRRRVLGFTDQMDELLAAADLVVTKPGGLTTSEALARGAAMCLVNPIPGQEARNCDFLLENGCAVKANNLATLGYKIGSVLADPGRLAALKRNAGRMGRPRAAFDIVTSSLKLIR